MQLFEPLIEIELIFSSTLNPDISSRIQTPSLRLDLRDGRDLAQPRNIGIFQLRKPLLEDRLRVRLELRPLVAIQSHDVGEEFELLRRELANRSSHLLEVGSRVDKQNLVLAIAVPFASIEE